MITRLNVASIYVLDKEEALDFYVNKLGLEKGSDVKQGDYRWLTVRVPGHPEVEISLEQPGPPLHDEATAEQLRELITKGALAKVLEISDRVRDGAATAPLDDARRAAIEQLFEQWSGEGLRVLGVAVKPMPRRPVYAHDDETAMIFAGDMARRIWTPTCPRPPTPMTTAVEPGTSRGSERLTAWYGVRPASVSGAACVTSSSPIGMSWRAGTETRGAMPPSRPSPMPPGGTLRHSLSRPCRQARQRPHPRMP